MSSLVELFHPTQNPPGTLMNVAVLRAIDGLFTAPIGWRSALNVRGSLLTDLPIEARDKGAACQILDPPHRELWSNRGSFARSSIAGAKVRRTSHA